MCLGHSRFVEEAHGVGEKIRIIDTLLRTR